MNNVDAILLVLTFLTGFVSVALYSIYVVLLEIRDKP